MSTAMNFGYQRKEIIRSGIACIGLAMMLAMPVFAAVDWGFGDNSNPYSADQGSGTATKKPRISPPAKSVVWMFK